jgi:hypothetical protein
MSKLVKLRVKDAAIGTATKITKPIIAGATKMYPAIASRVRARSGV